MSKEPDPAVVAFGARLKERREVAKISQVDLAKKAGLDQHQISNLERGARGLDAKNLLKLLAAARELGIGELVGLESAHESGELPAGDPPESEEAS